jgi:hypothetical protein
MSKKDDTVALAHLIGYSLQEAERLGLPEIISRCLRVAGAELTTVIQESGGDKTSGDAVRPH